MGHLGINIVDLSIIVILLVSGLLALIRGLVREVVELGVWAGSVVFTAYAYPIVKPWMGQHIKSEVGADAATALALFCASLIILIPLGNLISSLIRGQTLTAIDRSLGFVFGLLRGVLVVCLLYLGASWVWQDLDTQPEWLKQAHARPFMITGSNMIKALVPKDKLKAAATDVRDNKEAIDTAAERLEQLNKLTTPVPESKPQPTTTYGDDSRTKLDQLIHDKGK